MYTLGTITSYWKEENSAIWDYMDRAKGYYAN